MAQRELLSHCAMALAIFALGISLGVIIWVLPGVGGLFRNYVLRLFNFSLPTALGGSGSFGFATGIFINNVIMTAVLAFGAAAVTVLTVKLSRLSRGRPKLPDSTFLDERVVYPLAEKYAPKLKRVSNTNKNICIFLYLVPIFILVYNGMVIGGLLAEACLQGALPQFAAAIAPHGALELPLVIVSAAIGLSIASSALADVGHGGTRPDHIKKSARLWGQYAIVVVVLLLDAALIEAFVTPAIIAAV